VNFPGLIIGLAAVIAALLFPVFVKPEVRWGVRDPTVFFDFSRPFHERELAMACEILVFLFSHQGLFIAGLMMTTLSLSGG